VNETSSGRHLVPRYDAKPTATNAALLIDFDNVTMGVRSDLQHQLRQLMNSEIIKGKVAVQRAYADWRRYPQYIAPLSEASIDLIFAPAFGSNKKNATDIRLAIDALELVFLRPEIGTFILLSGDSDFSSLVLKLKEYGKWVIGVGLRESASDLLMQNCDEYFSYNELTGLTKEGDVEIVRRDPWELVVEAVLRMRQTADVMRSDRLKQVMQQIDPHFDESDIGFNRFSKFVTEAHQRNLLDIKKLESGQFEIDLGPDANVLPEQEVAPEPSRKATDEGKVAQLTSPSKITLADGFELLKKALTALDAVEDIAINSELARDWMREQHNDPDDPMFEPARFRKLLRQAHDANIIDVTKDQDDYHVRLRRTEGEDDDDSSELDEAPAKREIVRDVESRKTPTAKTKKTTKRVAKSKPVGDRPKEKIEPSKEPEASKDEASVSSEKQTRAPRAKKAAPKKKPAEAKKTAALEKVEEADQKPAAEKRAEPSEPKPSSLESQTSQAREKKRGSLRGRGSSLSRKTKAPASSQAGPVVESASSDQAKPTPPPKGAGPKSIRGRGSSRSMRSKNPSFLPSIPPVETSSAQATNVLPKGQVESEAASVVRPELSAAKGEVSLETRNEAEVLPRQTETEPKKTESEALEKPKEKEPKKTESEISAVKKESATASPAAPRQEAKPAETKAPEEESEDDTLFLRMAKALQRAVQSDGDGA